MVSIYSIYSYLPYILGLAMVIAHKVIRPTQSTFILGRNILEGVVILHETIHELHMKKMDGVLFKIYFEKA
jgi:hypothetical protein